MAPIHSLLKRQLRRHLGAADSLPEEWRNFVDAVNSAYFESDADRRMLERSLELTSKELLNANSEMRAVFERLINSSIDGIFAFDRECHYTVWNPALERILGIDKLQALGKSAFDVIPAFKESGEEKYYYEALSGKTVVAQDRLYTVASTGEQIFIESHFSPLFDDAGGIIGGIAILRDITQRKHAEDALRRSEAYLAEAQRLSHTGSFGWNVSTGDIFGSDETFRIFEYAPADLKPTVALILERVFPDDRTTVEQLMNRVSHDGSDWDVDCRLLPPSGSIKYVHIVAHAVRDISGKLEYVGAVIDVTESKKAEDRFRKAFNANPEPIAITTVSEGRYIDVNDSFLRVTGYRREEVIGSTSLNLKFWSRLQDRANLVTALVNQGSVRDTEIRFQTKSGEERIGLHSADVIELGGQKCILAIVKDITEGKLLENRLRQSQKMEAIGQFSGGIAHDFNNLLSVIMGYNGLLLERLDVNGPLHKHAQRISEAADRAASLVRQLLAFSRQQVVEMKVLDLNKVVGEMAKLLPRLIGEQIELRTSLDPGLGQVKADQGQIEQVVMNLAVNARDAMLEGGKLVMETKNSSVDQEYALRHSPMIPGDYVTLIVSDTGIGMDPQTLARIFEPFFTTKEQGKGTGLGLATVYGAVKQNGGYVWVESELGRGTTFRVFLPLLRAKVSQTQVGDVAPCAPARGSETILLVEDEESLRSLTRNLLEESGYRVLEAPNGSDALTIARNHAGRIDLLLTDVVMPGINGPVAAEKLRLICPEMKVVFMSGYTGFHDSTLRDFKAPLIAKPFTRDSLLRVLRETLASNQQDDQRRPEKPKLFGVTS